jgi:type II secretory pathway pseudopilin PulG
MQSDSSHPRDDPESGYVLLAVIFLTVVLLISLAIAAPKIATEIQRDKDIETIHRGEQYRRALQLYYRNFGAYPTSIDQLKQTNNVRYLRKEYADPETGKNDWKPVLYGQAHVRPLGFFGQPLSGVAGVGAASAVMGGAATGMYAISSTTTTTDENGIPVASDSGNAAGSGPGMSSGSDSGLGSGSNSGFGSSFGNGSSSGFGSSFGNGSGGFGGSGLSSGQSGSGFGSSGSGLSGFQSSGSSVGGSSPGFGSSNSTSGNGSSGSTFGGGGPIVGFTLTLNKPSLVAYMLQTRYNKWEFNYDPIADQMMAAASLFGGSPTDGGASGTTSGFGGTSTGSGGASNSGGISQQFGPNGNLNSPFNNQNSNSNGNQNNNPNGSGGTNAPQ